MYCAWRGRLCEPIDLLARILESLPLVLILRSLSIKSFAIKTCHSPTQLYKKPSPSLLLFPLTHITLAFLTLHRREKMDSGGSKRTCFIEEDDGLASVADMEAGFSGNHSQNNNNNNNYALFSRPLSYARSSLKNLSTSSPSSVCFSPRSGGARFYDARFEEQLPHFLDACFLCKKPLGNRDIYMYRGDVPFCSEECRQEKMDEDEAKEKKLSLSSTMKALRKKSTSPTRNQDYSYRTSTVAAA